MNTKVTIIPSKPGTPEIVREIWRTTEPVTASGYRDFKGVESVIPAGPAEPERVVIETSPEVAQVLADIAAVVGGPPHSRRRWVVELADALCAAGYKDQPGRRDNAYRCSDMEDDAAVYFR